MIERANGEDRDWQPLLEGESAAEALAVVQEIVDAVALQPPSRQQGLQDDASLALLLAHCHHPAASHKLDSALSAATKAPLSLSLFSGVSGLLWLLHRVGASDEADALVAHLDAAVLECLSAPHWTDRYDLVSGLVGAGVATAARDGARAARISDRVLSLLEGMAIFDEHGATWRTSPKNLSTARRDQFPSGVIDVGVAHGVPGVIGLLAMFIEADVQRARCCRLLHAAASWLLGVIPPGRPRFGATWPEFPGEFRRIAWCYGDPGVAGVLLNASRALRSQELEREAIGLLRNAITPVTERHIPDASFCHGTAGLAHLYNVAFQRTGDQEMRAQALRWIQDTVHRRRPGVGIAGYQFLRAEQAGRWVSDTTLVSGVVGIGLVLLAAVEDREPTWHELFLL